ncbi:MAG: Transcriptional regulator, TetR family protein [Deltaproteobacteria bacterium]|nr:Transcriptional regulator, TetR family protein [Deltaproteobacteria bacterium]
MSSENKTAKVELRWVKPARQDRSRDTHDRLIEAAERLLARDRSWDDITVAELVKEAGASVGAFYNRFRDKDALLHVLQIELYKQGEATAASAQLLGASEFVALSALIRAFVTLAVTAYRQQHGLRRALLVQMASDKQFRDRSIELSRLTCEGLTGVMQARYPTLDRAALRTAIDVAHRMVYGVLDQNLMYGDAPTDHVLADSTLVEQLTLAVELYLEHELGPAS